MSFRIGIIGCGAIGNVHADTAHASGLEVAGTWDLIPDRVSSIAERFPGCTAHASVDALLASDIDAVAVAVSNRCHRECAIAALQAGKHVLLEKPMATTVAECDEIIAAHAASDRVLQLGLVCRGAPVSLAVKRYIDAGRFGRIYHAKCAFYRRRGIPGLGGWFTTKAESGGGPLIDLGVHVLDLAMYLTGSDRPTRASGHAVACFGSPIADYKFTSMWSGPPKLEGVFDVEDGAVALVRFADGMTHELNVTWAANLPEGTHPNGITLLGEKAGCHFDVFGDRLDIATEDEGMIADITPYYADDRNNKNVAWMNQYRQFIEAVEEGTTPHADGAAGRRVQSVIDAIYRSSEAGCEVEVEA
ncbi:MAG: Gfo/Idh/MocA family oxidoreductase [Planctomycetota bacterium]|nr:Gfo/Idh/MocA family oxidoreductase [Planctomycetota bacterium]